MNKRQKKKLGLPYQKIKVGSRVVVTGNTMDGHEIGTVGNVIDINDNDICAVLGKCEISGRQISYFQCASELRVKKVKKEN